MNSGLSAGNCDFALTTWLKVRSLRSSNVPSSCDLPIVVSMVTQFILRAFCSVAYSDFCGSIAPRVISIYFSAFAECHKILTPAFTLPTCAFQSRYVVVPPPVVYVLGFLRMSRVKTVDGDLPGLLHSL